jgi:hypothetical protein
VITIKLTQDIEDQGLYAGDIMQVDKFSAASMVKRGVAEQYDPAEDELPAVLGDGQDAEYGGQPAATIDDIRDPDAQRDRRVTTVVHVAGADPGPPASPPPALVPDPAPEEGGESPRKISKKAAPGAEPDGGDAGGGDSS